ncbi:TetR family transcriptional regulator C-terminal domain-containing protein [Paenibacillaceae bacterium WGS1546]|uniref:TetR family transcriptional regulator C-terminal domain-containing protein n=1 Tax=Cohnella sp. WGS1546 TaxID=3366810 RepID=UPI00372CFE73
MRNENAAETLKETLDAKRKYIADSVAAVSRFPEAQSEAIASILYAVIEGLGLQKVADPGFRYDEAYAMLTEMMVAYYEKAVDTKKT